jgi:BirA family biotin operon repressor/biotin-[acetyl-CoA-carboxylase] ligase
MADVLDQAAGYRRIALGDVGSTNDEALEMGRTARDRAFWVTAVSQSRGKARRGRSWVSDPGNLYASLLLIDPAPAADVGTLPLAAALAVYRALEPFLAGTSHELSIKWPNDVLVDGAKINGILLEREQYDDGRTAVVIGCGINCAHHPETVLYPTTSLAACGLSATAEDVFAALAAEMVAVLQSWDRGRGFAAIREAWKRAAHGLGSGVTVNLADGPRRGIFEDVDADGYLLLLGEDGRRMRISSGDLFFSPAPGNGR